MPSCPKCNGKRGYNNECKLCNGTGWMDKYSCWESFDEYDKEVIVTVIIGISAIIISTLFWFKPL